MSHWDSGWTPEVVESNYRALGCIDHEDVVQLIKDSIALRGAEERLQYSAILLMEANNMIKRLLKEIQK